MDAVECLVYEPAMDDLIEALTIFRKYKNVTNPMHCEHDTLMVVDVTKEEVSEQNAKRLEELGFLWSESSDGCWLSYRFGSA